MIHSVRKHSRKRDAILQVIKSTASHPGAQWVYDQLKPAIPDLSLGTVYRNISIFRREGRVISVGVVGGEERFDGRVEPHPHFVCEGCGAVFDLGEEIQLEINTKLSIELTGCTIDKKKTVFYGICNACSEGRSVFNESVVPSNTGTINRGNAALGR